MRYLGPAFRQLAPGVFGINEEYKQLMKSSIRLSQPNFDHTAIIVIDPQSSYVPIHRAGLGILWFWRLQKNAYTLVAWSFCDHLSFADINVLPLLIGLQDLAYPACLPVGQGPRFDIFHSVLHRSPFSEENRGQENRGQERVKK
jgi:hypothetical protein